MKRLVCLAFCALFLASLAVAQAAAPAPASFLFGIGGGYNTSGYNGAGGQKAAALVNFGFLPANSNIWTIATLVTQPGKTSGINTLRGGIGYSLKKSGNWNLIAIADAGGTATNTALLGNVGGGVIARYDLGGIIKSLAGQGVGISAGMRIAAISGTSVQPEYMLTVSKKF